MQYLILAYDYKDKEALNRRMRTREAHIELGDQLRSEGKLIFGVAILNDERTMIGSMLVAEFENREKLDEWLKVEPYVTGNVWEKIEVKPCKVGPSFVNR